MRDRIAAKAAKQSEHVVTNSTRVDTVSYMHLITVQTIALTNGTKQSRSP